jgi:hypothetical protein
MRPVCLQGSHDLEAEKRAHAGACSCKSLLRMIRCCKHASKGFACLLDAALWAAGVYLVRPAALNLSA